MSKRKAPAVNKDETKRQKFIRLAEKRTNNALKYLAMIGALAVPSYEYTKADADAITKTLQDAVDRVKDRFDGKHSEVSGFTLTEKK